MRAICQYFIRQNYSVMSSLLHNPSFYVYNRPTATCVSLIDSCVQGQNVSKEFWTPEVREELACQHEEGNLNDGIVVSHLWRKILTACSLFRHCQNIFPPKYLAILYQQDWLYILHYVCTSNQHIWAVV